MSSDFTERLQEDVILSGLRPGEPCNHPGCASHMSHPCEAQPCEGCGRYAAGLQNGPDIAAGRIYIQELACNDPAIQTLCRLQEKHNWSWQQVMIAIIIKQSEINKDLTDKLNDAIGKRPAWHPDDRPK